VRFITKRAKHSDHFAAVSVRVEKAGKSFVYSGDSSYTEELVELCQNADVAILEAGAAVKEYRERGARPNHLSPQEDGLIAQQAGIKTLVLAHLNDLETEEEILAAVRENFTGTVHVARDQQTFSV